MVWPITEILPTSNKHVVFFSYRYLGTQKGRKNTLWNGFLWDTPSEKRWDELQEKNEDAYGLHIYICKQGEMIRRRGTKRIKFLYRIFAKGEHWSCAVSHYIILWNTRAFAACLPCVVAYLAGFLTWALLLKQQLYSSIRGEDERKGIINIFLKTTSFSQNLACWRIACKKFVGYGAGKNRLKTACVSDNFCLAVTFSLYFETSICTKVLYKVKFW